MFELNEILSELKGAAQIILKADKKPEDLVSFVTNKDGSLSAWMVEPITKSKTKLLFKLELKGKENSKYISVMMKTINRKKFEIPQNATEKILKSSPENTYLIFENDLYYAISFLKKVIITGVSDFQPSDRFGCCHRYVECSREGKCIHPDQFYALACWYRKNLEAGKVFY